MQEPVEQADSAWMVLQSPMGTAARLAMVAEALRQVDHERPVPEKLRRRGAALPLHPGSRSVRQGEIPAGLQLRQGLESRLFLQRSRDSLRKNRRAQVSEVHFVISSFRRPLT